MVLTRPICFAPISPIFLQRMNWTITPTNPIWLSRPPRCCTAWFTLGTFWPTAALRRWLRNIRVANSDNVRVSTAKDNSCFQSVNTLHIAVDGGTTVLEFVPNEMRFVAGLSDIPGEAMVKIYCPKCIDVYNPKSSRHHHTDGAYFGTGFPHMLFMVHPEYRPKRPTNQFVPR